MSGYTFSWIVTISHDRLLLFEYSIRDCTRIGSTPVDHMANHGTAGLPNRLCSSPESYSVVLWNFKKSQRLNPGSRVALAVAVARLF